MRRPGLEGIERASLFLAAVLQHRGQACCLWAQSAHAQTQGPLSVSYTIPGKLQSETAPSSVT